MIFGPDWSFIEVPKNASSAIGDALLPHCAPVHPRLLPDGKLSKHEIPRPGSVPRMPYRLGVVRNPWDRMISGWSYYNDRHPEAMVSLRDFVLDPSCVWNIGRKPGLIPFQTTPQTAWLYGCNHVLRYELLSIEFAQWSEKVIGHPLTLPRTNASSRSGGYMGYYTDDRGKFDLGLIDAVADMFAIDCEVFGYAF